MGWRIDIDDAALKDLRPLDPPIARRITIFLRQRLALLDDPRSIGEALGGERLGGERLGEFWKYRVGDWRMIARIEDQAVRILVVRIGNWRSMYR